MDNYVHSNPDQYKSNRGRYYCNSGGGYERGEPYQPMPPPPPIPTHSSDSYPFFLVGGGISRQVIQTDLPRYLGNNSQSKPGYDEYGRPGFWYKGYRQLTDAQTHTLRETSAKWKDEQQQHASHGSGYGPDYVDSHTFEDSYRNSGGNSRRELEPLPRPLVTPVERPDQEPQYRYMPPPDNRPWYDNWSRKYVHPFREPGAKSPEPPAQDQIPRYIANSSEPVARSPPEEDGFAIPVDKNTGLPIPGEWTQDRDGGWLFHMTGDPNRSRSTQSHRGRNDLEERTNPGSRSPSLARYPST